MTIKTGDIVTIKRGKTAGTKGAVREAVGDQAVVLLDSGELNLQKITNLNAAPEPTISLGDLAAILVKHEDATADLFAGDLTDELSKAYPGFAEKLDAARHA